MQYGRSLEHLIREVVIADTTLVPIYALKYCVSDGFYPIALQPGDVPKLVLFSPSYGNGEELV